jgi:hypothetical protein
MSGISTKPLPLLGLLSVQLSGINDATIAVEFDGSNHMLKGRTYTLQMRTGFALGQMRTQVSAQLDEKGHVKQRYVEVMSIKNETLKRSSPIQEMDSLFIQCALVQSFVYGSEGNVLLKEPANLTEKAKQDFGLTDIKSAEPQFLSNEIIKKWKRELKSSKMYQFELDEDYIFEKVREAQIDYATDALENATKTITQANEIISEFYEDEKIKKTTGSKIHFKENTQVDEKKATATTDQGAETGSFSARYDKLLVQFDECKDLINKLKEK